MAEVDPPMTQVDDAPPAPPVHSVIGDLSPLILPVDAVGGAIPGTAALEAPTVLDEKTPFVTQPGTSFQFSVHTPVPAYTVFVTQVDPTGATLGQWKMDGRSAQDHRIHVPVAGKAGDTLRFNVVYQGVPPDTTTTPPLSANKQISVSLQSQPPATIFRLGQPSITTSAQFVKVSGTCAGPASIAGDVSASLTGGQFSLAYGSTPTLTLIGPVDDQGCYDVAGGQDRLSGRIDPNGLGYGALWRRYADNCLDTYEVFLGPWCGGTPTVVFDNWNSSPVSGGGQVPSINLANRSCIDSIATYHWNGGLGESPGTIWMVDPGGFGVDVSPWKAVGSTGTAGAPNVNWTATPSWPVVLRGAYTLHDSAMSTWSQNSGSGGSGFARVSILDYVGPGSMAANPIVRTLLPGTVGVPYSASLLYPGLTTTGVWSIAAGMLPPGIALGGTGTLSGTPTTAGTSSFRANLQVGTKLYFRDQTLVVNPAPVSSVSARTWSSVGSWSVTSTEQRNGNSLIGLFDGLHSTLTRVSATGAPQSASYTIGTLGPSIRQTYSLDATHVLADMVDFSNSKGAISLMDPATLGAIWTVETARYNGLERAFISGIRGTVVFGRQSDAIILPTSAATASSPPGAATKWTMAAGYKLTGLAENGSNSIASFMDGSSNVLTCDVAAGLGSVSCRPNAFQVPAGSSVIGVVANADGGATHFGNLPGGTLFVHRQDASGRKLYSVSYAIPGLSLYGDSFDLGGSLITGYGGSSMVTVVSQEVITGAVTSRDLRQVVTLAPGQNLQGSAAEQNGDGTSTIIGATTGGNGVIWKGTLGAAPATCSTPGLTPVDVTSSVVAVDPGFQATTVGSVTPFTVSTVTLAGTTTGMTTAPGPTFAAACGP